MIAVELLPPEPNREENYSVNELQHKWPKSSRIWLIQWKGFGNFQNVLLH